MQIHVFNFFHPPPREKGFLHEYIPLESHLAASMLMSLNSALHIFKEYSRNIPKQYLWKYISVSLCPHSKSLYNICTLHNLNEVFQNCRSLPHPRGSSDICSLPPEPSPPPPRGRVLDLLRLFSPDQRV